MPQKWLCVVCSRSLSSRSSRNRHQNTVHNFRTICCPHCMTILKSQIQLTLHLLRLQREEKGTQTTPPNTPNSGPAENTAIPPPPLSHQRIFTSSRSYPWNPEIPLSRDQNWSHAIMLTCVIFHTSVSHVRETPLPPQCVMPLCKTKSETSQYQSKRSILYSNEYTLNTQRNIRTKMTKKVAIVNTMDRISKRGPCYPRLFLAHISEPEVTATCSH